MATFQKFYPFIEALAEKTHNLGSDQLKVALTSVAPVNTNAVLADLTQISYTNLSSRDIVTTSSAQTGGVYKLTVADLVLTATGGSVEAFRYVVVYNDTAASDNLICFFDYGSSLELATGESLTIDFSATNGILQLS